MLSATIDNLIQDLKIRQQEILTHRFGLNDGKKKTLADIGEKYNLTRERVRQIEEESLRIIQNKLNEEEETIKEIKRLIADHLKNLGGLRRNDLLLQELKYILKNNDLHHWHLRFFSEIFGQPLYYPEDKNFHDFWYTSKDNIQSVDQFSSQLKKTILDKKNEIVVHGQFHDYLVKITKIHRISDSVGLNYISTSKKFGINSFGDLGLSHWEEIRPKTIRSKTYLILKKHGKPLHFKNIAKSINKISANKRPALPQTVHNELIKDKRFVLVGRGIYGLTEHGFKPGIAQEVIRRTLKENGPLNLKDIISKVSEQRILKENTIVLNLQNKNYFKKTNDGKYCLA